MFLFPRNLNSCDKTWRVLGPQKRTGEVLNDLRGEKLVLLGG